MITESFELPKVAKKKFPFSKQKYYDVKLKNLGGRKNVVIISQSQEVKLLEKLV